MVEFLPPPSARKTAKPIGRKIARFLAGRTVFAILIFVGVAMGGWLVWQRAIAPLQTEAGLPSGVPNEISRFDQEAINAISQGRSSRATHQLHSYTRFTGVFIENTRVIQP